MITKIADCCNSNINILYEYVCPPTAAPYKHIFSLPLFCSVCLSIFFAVFPYIPLLSLPGEELWNLWHFRSAGAGWCETRIVSRVPARIRLSLMSELHNVSILSGLAFAICGKQRGFSFVSSGSSSATSARWPVLCNNVLHLQWDIEEFHKDERKWNCKLCFRTCTLCCPVTLQRKLDCLFFL